MTTINKKNIKYGKADLLSDEDFKNPKIRITMMVDEEILKIFKAKAKESGEGYQTLMNRTLRESALKPSLEERVSKLEALVERAS
jgi:uncharacterized protein (DUF4415 family)